MSIEKLLSPRYKVIVDYPNSIYKVGEVVQQSGKEFFNTDFFDKYPQFQKLEWWQERKREEMPEYVKFAHSNTVLKVDAHGFGIYMESMVKNDNYFIADEAGHYYALFLPSTKEEYEAFKITH